MTFTFEVTNNPERFDRICSYFKDYKQDITICGETDILVVHAPSDFLRQNLAKRLYHQVARIFPYNDVHSYIMK